MRYEDSSLSGSFQDQGPVARDDADQLAAGDRGPATGNVISGAGTETGASGADAAAAGARVVAVSGAGGNDSSFEGGRLRVEGEHGTLSLTQRGDYSYTAKAGVPENSRDTFTYTLSDSSGATSQARLMIEIGKTQAVVKADAQRVVPGPDGVVVLPAGVELSDIRIVGRDLLIILPDGSQMLIVDGAVFVPQLVINDIEVPSTNLAALLIDQEPRPASGVPQSSGGNFIEPVGPLDPGTPLGDLLPPTQLPYTPPEFNEVAIEEDREPEAGANPLVQIDDDARPGGNAGGTGDDPDSVNATGTLSGSGGDGPLTFAFNTAGAPAGFSYSVAANGALIVSQGQTVVLTVTLNAQTGAYVVTQNAPIQHAAGDNENNIVFTFSYTVTDSDGDQAAGTLQVNVDDDTPTASTAQVTGTVDEDGVPGGIAGGTGDVAGENAVASGSVATLFNSGADAPLSYALLGDTSGLPALTSGGVAVTYAVSGNTLTASAGGNAVFTFTLTAAGNWTFTLLDQLDHAAGSNENDLTIALGSIIQATDKDGDSVAANANGLVITVDDDTPTARNDTDAVLAGADTTDGNVITGVDTTSGVAGADSPGADAPAAVTGLASNNVPANVDNDPAGGFVVAGQYGLLTMQTNGSYLYDRNDGAPGDVQDVFTYSYTDKDGDTVTATLTIGIQDSAPVLTAPPPALLDDDDVIGKNGNPGGVGDDAPANTSGSLAGLVTGGDGDIDFSFAGSQPSLPTGFTHNLVNASTMQILQNGTIVLTVTLNNETGAYTIVQNNPIVHAAGSNENNIGPINIGLVAIDEDGTGDLSNVVNLAISVDDDTPVATATQLTGTVDEDGVVEGAADSGPGDGIAGGIGDVAGQVVSAPGNVAGLFSIGADGLGSYSLLSNFAGLAAQNLTSGGVALSYAVVLSSGVYTLTATAGPGGDPVFTFTLNATTGAYNFTLIDQLDHPTGNNENDLTINLSSIIQATDSDGDSVVAGANGLIITVDDDSPIATNAQIALTVDEDGVVENGAPGIQKGDGIPGGTGDVAGEVVNVSGSLATLFQSGADEGLSYALLNNFAGLPVLTSGGAPVTYAVALNAGVYTLTASAAGQTVFTLTVNASTGAYSFTLVDQLDHALGNGENDLLINLSSIIQATDRDGDSVVAGPEAFVITVDDDSPVVNAVTDPLNIANTGTPSGTGAFDFDIGADENADNDDIAVSGFTVSVNGVAATNVQLVAGAETASTANYTFSFTYPVGGGNTANGAGSLIFNKDSGTYTVSLDSGPIEGFSILATGSADASAFVSYQSAANPSGSPEITVAQLDTDFFVQFTGIAEPSSGTGANNLYTSLGDDNNFSPVSTDNFAGLELFKQSEASVTVSSTAAGVAGNTIQGGEVLDFNLYSANPTDNLGGIPTAEATEMFILLDGVGTSEDMIVVLKLYDTVTGEYTTKALMVQNSDIIKTSAGLAGTPYSTIELDNNDGIIVIQANDYQEGNTNLVIVGGQIAGSDEGITGTAIDLVGTLGAGGESTGTQAFSTDTSDAPFKITSIGFLTNSTEDQQATIEFDVTLEDGDGDSVTVNDVTVNIGGVAPLATATSLASSTQLRTTESSTTTFAALAAAVGMMSEPLAAQPADVGSDADVSFDALAVSSTSFSVDGGEVAGGKSDGIRFDALRSSAVEEMGGNDHGPIQRFGGAERVGLDDGASIGAAGGNQPLDHGTDLAVANVPAFFSGGEIVMPSAEQMMALAGPDAESIQRNPALEQVLSDALAGGGSEGLGLDALIDAAVKMANPVQHQPGEMIAELASGGDPHIPQLATQLGNAVPGWDAGHFSALFHGAAAAMDAAALHPDAVQPAANG